MITDEFEERLDEAREVMLGDVQNKLDCIVNDLVKFVNQVLTALPKEANFTTEVARIFIDAGIEGVAESVAGGIVKGQELYDLFGIDKQKISDYLEIYTNKLRDELIKTKYPEMVEACTNLYNTHRDKVSKTSHRIKEWIKHAET